MKFPVKPVTNEHQVHISAALWLAVDEYVAESKPNTYSVTTLIKPLRQIILGQRVKNAGGEILDVTDNASSAIGTAIHDKIKQVWTTPELLMAGLKNLKFPAKRATRVAVNPDPEWLKKNPDALPVYVEQRFEREINGVIITGEPDLVFDGVCTDHKKTSTYKYNSQSGIEHFLKQGSIYRWLVPHIITSDEMIVNMIFTDWKAGEVGRVHNYPEVPVKSISGDLVDLEDVEEFLIQRTNDIKRLEKVHQSKLPECTPEELWQAPPVFKYYATQESADAGKRATKNFDSDDFEQGETEAKAAAEAHAKAKGKGVIIEVKGKPKACKYCAAFEICEQRIQMQDAGLL